MLDKPIGLALLALVAVAILHDPVSAARITCACGSWLAQQASVLADYLIGVLGAQPQPPR